MSDVKSFDSSNKNTWCPGCGDFGILASLKEAFANQDLMPHQVSLMSGIGCSGHLTDFINVYGFNGLHGRALPLATGMKLANHSQHVVVVGGDGDGYGIGMGHFVHAIRRNVNLTYVVHNNQVYGLTTGQASATAMKGYKSRSTPEGVIEEPMNPLALALSLKCGFVARGFAGDPKHLAMLIEAAMKHEGFSFVDVLQPCVTFNKVNTFGWFKDRVYHLEGHDTENLALAELKAREVDKLPIGIFYEGKGGKAYEACLPQLKQPLVDRDLDKVSIEYFMKKFC